MRDENYVVYEEPLTEDQTQRLRAGDFSEFVDTYASPNFTMAIVVGLCLWGGVALIGWALYRVFN
jgi:hypothetical protein